MKDRDLLELSMEMVSVIREDVKNNNGNAINWNNIVHTYKLSEDFIGEFQYYISMSNILAWQELSEEFIQKFIKVLDINSVFYHQHLSEEFLIKLVTKNSYTSINWANLSYKQKLSKEFIIQFANKINFEYLLANENISQEIKDYCRMFT